ncbi:MAG: hypothetical protein ACRC5A_11830, partial [Enterobacteriaceae bacterium]
QLILDPEQYPQLSPEWLTQLPERRGLSGDKCVCYQRGAHIFLTTCLYAMINTYNRVKTR